MGYRSVDDDRWIKVAGSLMPTTGRISVVKLAFLTTWIVPTFFFGSFVQAQHGFVATENSQWIRPTKPGDPLLWGRKDGIVFGLPSDGGLQGPRGLIRVGVISSKTEKPELLNFIAIEPVVAGRGERGDRMAFSELEPSQLDAGAQGKRLWIGPSDAMSPSAGSDGSDASNGSKQADMLTVRIEVERFQANGAHVYLIASMMSDHPNEVRIAVHRYEDSPQIEELTLSATMGNYERLRWLWLKNEVIDSRKLYRAYRGHEFAERGTYPKRRMLRTADEDAIVFCTSNEAHPEANPDFQAKDHWRYRLDRLTQYWKVPASDIERNLRVRVNGRHVYWQSTSPIAGGIAFENFEVRQRYKAGQVFIFGVTPKEPWQIEPVARGLHRPMNPENN
jgi:hypothetical protein